MTHRGIGEGVGVVSTVGGPGRVVGINLSAYMRVLR